MDNLRHIYDLNQQEVQVLSDAISTSNDLFKVGYATYLEVITAQRNVLEAEINQVETKKKFFMSLINSLPFYRRWLVDERKLICIRI